MAFPGMSVTIGGADETGNVSTAIQLLFMLTVLSLAPAILLMLTSFTRIVVVLSLVRQAIGTQQMPPNQIIICLSLFLTFFVMMPTWQKVHTDALTPFYEDRISGEQALEKAIGPIRGFMLKQTRERDISLFVKISRADRPEKPEDIGMSALIPAFAISELKTAFQMGFMIYLPFLIIDMVVSSILLSMGMMMLPPVMISLPFKLMLFVLVDGWYLIVESLVKSFS
jgi:flagellar biosynthetic protein FliP